MSGIFVRPMLGILEFDAGALIEDPADYGIGANRYIPPEKRTLADIRLINKCKTLAFWGEMPWLANTRPDNEGNPQPFPPDFQWDFEKWAKLDPILAQFIEREYQIAEENAEIYGYEPPDLSIFNNRLPHPRAAYFSYATVQAIMHKAWARKVKAAKEGVLELDLSFVPYDSSSFDWSNPPTMFEIYTAIKERLGRLGVMANAEKAIEKKVAEWKEAAGALYPLNISYHEIDLLAAHAATNPFWHWGTLQYGAGSGILLEEPSDCGCPSVFPAAMVELKRYIPIVEATDVRLVETTVITEYEMPAPIWFGPDTSGFGFYYDDFNGAYVKDEPSLPEPGTPTYGANTDTREVVTTSGDTTTTQTNAAYAVFQVREWYLGPQINPNTGNLVGVASRPTLMLIDEEGNSFERSSSPERIRLRERAERMAVEQLYAMWGFIPAWANMNGFNRDTYVNFHRGFFKSFDSWKYWYKSASMDEKQRMQNFDYVFPYIFSVMVANESSNVTTTTNTTTSTTTTTEETIESISYKVPTITVTETRTEQHVRAFVKLSFKQLEHYESYPYPWSLLSWEDYVSAMRSPYCVGMASAVTAGGYASNDLTWLVYRPFEGDPTWQMDEYPSSLPEDIPEMQYWNLRALTLDQSRELTKGLFEPNHTILDYLPSIGKEALTLTKQTINTFLGQLPGSVWLNQYGSQAPLFPVFQEALVLDTQLNKWGKMSVPHRLLVDLSPVNSHRQRRVASSTFSIQAAMLGVEGELFTFNDKPGYSELRYGKLGYHRLGFTDLEEMRIWFAKQSTGTLQIEPSYSGDRPESSFIQEFEFDDTTSIVANYSLSARWYNVTLKGQYDVKGIEFIGRKSARR